MFKVDWKYFVESVGWGEEYSFDYNGEEYWISQNKEGRYLTRSRDSYTQDFETVEELFANGRIEGKTIAEIWGDINDQI